MFIYIYVYIYIYIYVYIYNVCFAAQSCYDAIYDIGSRFYLLAHTHYTLYIHVQRHKHTNTPTHVHTLSHTHTHTHIYARITILTTMYTPANYIHTHTYAWAHIRLPFLLLTLTHSVSLAHTHHLANCVTNTIVHNKMDHCEKKSHHHTIWPTTVTKSTIQTKVLLCVGVKPNTPRHSTHHEREPTKQHIIKHTHMCACHKCIYAYIYLYIHIYVCMYIYISIYTYIYLQFVFRKRAL